MKKNIFPKNYHKRRFLRIIGFAMIGSCGYGAYNYINSKSIKSTWSGSVLNAPAKLEIHTSSKLKNNKILAEVDGLVNKYENIFNLQNINSEICNLNNNKYLKSPSGEILEVLEKSLLLSKYTNGSFDATVQPLWNFYYNHYVNLQKKSPPKQADLNKVKKLINWKNINLSQKSVNLLNNASITLNGVAQGWITDKITELLKKNGIKNTLVDFGENYALGLYQNQRPWRILLQGPGDINKVVELSNKAVATSGGYGTIFEPTATYHHIFDAKTGLSANKFKAVSILSNHAWLSDGISTAAVSMNKKNLIKVCRKLNTIAYVVEKNKFNLLV